MRITEIRRYPVKSMLGERVDASTVGFGGLTFDRGLALIDVETGQATRAGAGPTVLRVSLPTPRCAVPTLEHGDLPRSVDAVRRLLTANRVDVPGFGVLPCAGGYAEVLREGALRVGDELALR
jgi:uncharacterized protein YcbX